MFEEQKKPETPNGKTRGSRQAPELKTFSVKDILLNFVPQTAADAVLDPSSVTTGKLVSRSVSFGAWLCLLPLICMSWCVQKVFHMQVSLLQSVVLTMFPDLP